MAPIGSGWSSPVQRRMSTIATSMLPTSRTSSTASSRLVASSTSKLSCSAWRTPRRTIG